MSTPITIGSPVIINHCDAPCTKLVAIVSKIDGGRVNAFYLAKDTNMPECYTSSPLEVTHLFDFGVRISIQGESFEIYQLDRSIAKYRDGKPRRWQGGPDIRKTRKRALALYLKHN